VRAASQAVETTVTEVVVIEVLEHRNLRCYFGEATFHRSSQGHAANKTKARCQAGGIGQDRRKAIRITGGSREGRAAS
jgi:hypothetical protein